MALILYLFFKYQIVMNPFAVSSLNSLYQKFLSELENEIDQSIRSIHIQFDFLELFNLIQRYPKSTFKGKKLRRTFLMLSEKYPSKARKDLVLILKEELSITFTYEVDMNSF